ncbi:M4 family metallopeptidase [Streptomyces sp. H27-D2]|uniref:M4 family metallopeptidase n=1 Tax=Streptomyces sp. H27-D2 TaxID=3046304 RepID=UPI002DBFF3D2|nr:M4 family metallopeptidase [Streptomyces sp. H27-D2]MEC4019723.1 M4 family metallopeptidase [Streptomyces sp. H27-D2]
MRSTTHRRAIATGALVAASAMLAVGVQTGTASAQPDDSGQGAKASAKSKPDPGALPAKLSPSQRAELLREANATKADTADSLGLGAKEKLVVRDVIKNADGTTHTRYERTYGGLPVIGGDLVVHEAKSGAYLGASKATKKKIKVAGTTAEVAAGTAKSNALKAAKAEGAKKTVASKAPRKVIWAGKGLSVLAWETVVGGLQKDGTPSELHVVNDARSGKVLTRFQGVKGGTGESQYSGQVNLGTTQTGDTWSLTDYGRGDHKTYDLNHGGAGTGTLFTDPDDLWGDGTPANAQTAGVDAAYGAGLTWDYYKNIHGRTGIKGDGVGAYSRVHYGNNYVNAFWSDDCFCMTYGDGEGDAKPLTSIDVAAHEMTHGVTAATANLIYAGESGGLNEATSDIFAAAVEFNADNAQDVGDYMVGEKIDINGDGTPLRYMDEPSKDGGSKDYWYDGVGNVDVHYSSGIANHFFYLLSEGSGAKVINGVSYNSPTQGNLLVKGIGRANAEQVWFKALTEQMTSTTDFADARRATLTAAAELFGQNSPSYVEVANAWAGVNVGRPIVDGVDIIAPGDQLASKNTAASLQIQAASSNPGGLDYRATGLPEGLRINAYTGLISGTPKKEQTSAVKVTVKDVKGKSASTEFKWTVGPALTGKFFENTTPVAIPDAGGAAITSPVTVEGVEGSAPTALKVGVDITHTYRGDLAIDLIAPDGTVYPLKASSADPAPNVKETYSVNAVSEAAKGTWQLRVKDEGPLDIGTLNNWRLTF